MNIYQAQTKFLSVYLKLRPGRAKSLFKCAVPALTVNAYSCARVLLTLHDHDVVCIQRIIL